MADAKKKKSEPKKKSSTSTVVEKAPLSAEVAAVEAGKLHSPWIPLVWILVPLVLCTIYGFVTRSHGH
jgi:hypothetical protein